jgi:hypothetical protein
VFAVSIFIGLSGSNAMAEDGDWNLCGNNDEFTTDFRLEDCKFKAMGINPYFILKPGYRLVLETPASEEEREKSVETVLQDTKWINLDGRWIKTRVLEERAYELEDDGEEILVEISLNWFAICTKTNAVYYFGEFSRDCDSEETGGFDPDDESKCDDGSTPIPAGSWEAGKPPMDDPDGVIARPGLMMTGTPLIGSKYFQEIAPPDAVDRGNIVEMGLTWPLPEDLDEGETPDFTGCIKILDTNPAEDPPVCEDEDPKIYCPGIGLVQDQDLQLTFYGFVGDDDDDDDKRWRRKWGHHHRRF